MRKVESLYADFETTFVELPEGYKNYREYYLNEPEAVKPGIYDWVVTSNVDLNYLKSSIPNVGRRVTFDVTDEEKVYYSTVGIAGDSFLKYIESIDFDAIMYFNNMKSFDGHFIIPLLDQAGYQIVHPLDVEDISNMDEMTLHKMAVRINKIRQHILWNKKNRKEFDKLTKEDQVKANEWMDKKVKFKWNRLFPREYSVLADAGTNIMSIKIGLPSVKTTNGRKKNRVLQIRDNLHIFNASIKKMGETICKSYKVEDQAENKKIEDMFLKKELEGGYTRSHYYKSYKELENDGNQLEYLLTDSIILCKFHDLISEFFPRKKWKSTIASTSYKDWYSTFGKSLLKYMLEKGLVKVKHFPGKKFVKYIYKKKTYTTTGIYRKLKNEILPVKWLNSRYNEKDKDDHRINHNHIYEYYVAGRTMVNEKFRGQFLENVSMFDKNSSFPSSMASKTKFPIGVPIKGKKKVAGYDFHLYKLTVNKKIHNKHGLPFLTDMSSPKRNYLKTLIPGQTYRLTSISLPNFLKYYDPASKADYNLEIEWSFMSLPADIIFGDFINHWYGVKSDAKKRGAPVVAYIGKEMLNSSYGKHASKILRVSKLWNPEQQAWVSSKETVDAKFYLPLAIAITDHAAMSLVDTVANNYEEFVYCDTDSVAMINYTPEKYSHVLMDPYKINHWWWDLKKGHGLARNSKQYIFFGENAEGDPIRKIAFAGINFNRYESTLLQEENGKNIEKIFSGVTVKDFIVGKLIENQTAAENIIGSGVVIGNTVKSIKPIWMVKSVMQEQVHYYKKDYEKSLRDIEKFYIINRKGVEHGKV